MSAVRHGAIIPPNIGMVTNRATAPIPNSHSLPFQQGQPIIRYCVVFLLSVVILVNGIIDLGVRRYRLTALAVRHRREFKPKLLFLNITCNNRLITCCHRRRLVYLRQFRHWPCQILHCNSRHRPNLLAILAPKSSRIVIPSAQLELLQCRRT